MDMETALIYAIITIIIGIIVAGLARGIVRFLKKYAETTRTQWDDIIIAAIGVPVQVGIIAVSVYIALKYFGVVPEQYSWVISDKVLNSVYILLGTWIASSLAHNIILIYGHALAEKGEGPLDDRLIEFLELTSRYVIWFIGIMLILVNLDVNITPFLAMAGIVGLAFALAAQDLITNFYGGAVITIDKPLKVGDRVKIEQYYGDVIDIGARSTRLKTPDNQIITIPNNKVTTIYVTNYSEPD
jgi:small-conductance mechanosensitive channel